MGKGTAPRPYANGRADYELKWEETFGKKEEIEDADGLDEEGDEEEPE